MHSVNLQLHSFPKLCKKRCFVCAEVIMEEKYCPGDENGGDGHKDPFNKLFCSAGIEFLCFQSHRAC